MVYFVYSVIMTSLINVYDYEKCAQEKLPKMIWDFYKGGATNELTLNDNSAAFQRYFSNCFQF